VAAAAAGVAAAAGFAKPLPAPTWSASCAVDSVPSSLAAEGAALAVTELSMFKMCVSIKNCAPDTSADTKGYFHPFKS
jgi:hypothetical protein